MATTTAKAVPGVGTPAGVKAVPGVSAPVAKAAIPGVSARAPVTAAAALRKPVVAGIVGAPVTAETGVGVGLVNVGPGKLEAVSESDYSKLTAEQQEKLKELGIEKFRDWYKADFESKHTRVGLDQWVSNEEWGQLDEKQQAALKSYGIEGYGAWFGDNYTAVGPNKDKYVANDVISKLPADGRTVMLDQGPEAYTTWFGQNYVEIGTQSGDKGVVKKSEFDAIADSGAQNALITGGMAGYEQYIRDHTITNTLGETISTGDFGTLPPWAQTMFQSEGLAALNRVQGMTAQQKFAIYKKYGAYGPDGAGYVYFGEKDGEPISAKLSEDWQTRMYTAEGWQAVAGYDQLGARDQFNKLKRYGGVPATAVYGTDQMWSEGRYLDSSSMEPWQATMVTREGNANNLLNWNSLTPVTQFALMQQYGYTYTDDGGNKQSLAGAEYKGTAQVTADDGKTYTVPTWYTAADVRDMNARAQEMYKAYGKDTGLGLRVYQVAQRHPAKFAWINYMNVEGAEHLRKGEATLTEHTFEVIYNNFYDPETGHMKPGHESEEWTAEYFQMATAPGTMQKPTTFWQDVGERGFFPALAEKAHTGAVEVVSGWKTVSPIPGVWTITVPEVARQVAGGTWTGLVDVTLALPATIETVVRPLAPISPFGLAVSGAMGERVGAVEYKKAFVGAGIGLVEAAKGFGMFVAERPEAIRKRPLWEIPYTAVAFATTVEGGIKGGIKGVRATRGALEMKSFGARAGEVGGEAVVGLGKELAALPVEAAGFGVGAGIGAAAATPGFGVIKGGIKGVGLGVSRVRLGMGLGEIKGFADVGRGVKLTTFGRDVMGRAVFSGRGALYTGKGFMESLGAEVTRAAEMQRGRANVAALGVTGRAALAGAPAVGRAWVAGGRLAAEMARVGARTGARAVEAFGVAKGVEWGSRELMRIKTEPAAAQRSLLGGAVSTASRPLFNALVKAGDAVRGTAVRSPAVVSVRDAVGGVKGLSGASDAVVRWLKREDAVVGGDVADVVRGILDRADVLEVTVDTVKGKKASVVAAEKLATELERGGGEYRVTETPVQGYEVAEVKGIDPRTGKEAVVKRWVSKDVGVDATVQVRDGGVWRDAVNVGESISEAQGASHRFMEWVGDLPENIDGVRVRTHIDTLGSRLSDAVTPKGDGTIGGVDAKLGASLDAYAKELEAQGATQYAKEIRAIEDVGAADTAMVPGRAVGFGRLEVVSRELTALPREFGAAVGMGVLGAVRATPLGFVERVGRQVEATIRPGATPGGVLALSPDVVRVEAPDRLYRSLTSMEVDRGTLKSRLAGGTGDVKASLVGDELSASPVEGGGGGISVRLNADQVAEWNRIERDLGSRNSEVREIAGYDRAEFLNRIVGEDRMGGIAGSVEAIEAGMIDVPGVTTFRKTNLTQERVTAYTNIAMMMELERRQLFGVTKASDIAALKNVRGVEEVKYNPITHDVELIGPDAKVVAKATGAQRVFPNVLYHALPNMTVFREQLARQGYVEVDPGGWGGNLLFTSPHLGQAFETMRETGRVVDPGALAITINSAEIKLPPVEALEAKGGAHAMRDMIDQMVGEGRLDPGVYATWKHYGPGVVEYELGFTRGYRLYPSELAGYAKEVKAGTTSIPETRVTSMIEHTPEKILTKTGKVVPTMEKAIHVGETVPVYWLATEKGVPMPTLGAQYKAKAFGALATARRYLPWNIRLARAAGETEATRLGGMLIPKPPIRTIGEKVTMANIDGDLFRVADKALVVNKEGKILVTKHPAGTTWDLPGGGLAKGEQSIANVVRELEQELNVPPESLRVKAQLNDYVGGQYNRVFVVELTKEPTRGTGAPLSEVADFIYADERTPGLNNYVKPIMEDFRRMERGELRPYDATVGRLTPGTTANKVVFDLDGTLIDGKGRVAPGAVSTLRALQAAGKEVALWTHSTEARTAGILKSTGLDEFFNIKDKSQVIVREDYAIARDRYGKALLDEKGGKIPLPDYTYKDIRKIGGDVLVDNNVRQVQQQIDHGNNVIKTKTYRGEHFAPAMSRVKDALIVDELGELKIPTALVEELVEGPEPTGLRSTGAKVITAEERIGEGVGEELGAGLGYAYPKIGTVGVPAAGVTAEEFQRGARAVPIYEYVKAGQGGSAIVVKGVEEEEGVGTIGLYEPVPRAEERLPEVVEEPVAESASYGVTEPEVEREVEPEMERVSEVAAEAYSTEAPYTEAYTEDYSEPLPPPPPPPPPIVRASLGLEEERRLKRPELPKGEQLLSVLPWRTEALELHLPVLPSAPVVDPLNPRTMELWRDIVIRRAKYIKRARLGPIRYKSVSGAPPPEFREA